LVLTGGLKFHVIRERLHAQDCGAAHAIGGPPRLITALATVPTAVDGLITIIVVDTHDAPAQTIADLAREQVLAS
jgi:hypothetical protein